MGVLDYVLKRRKFKVRPPTEEKIGFDEFGAEIHPKGRAVEVPVRFRTVESRDAAVIRLIQSQLSRQMREAGAESLEESDDFEVDDDGEPVSPYEIVDMQDEEPIVLEDERGQKVLNLPPAKRPAAGAAGSSDMTSADVSPPSEVERPVVGGKT